jgi:hypothetical protein
VFAGAIVSSDEEGQSDDNKDDERCSGRKPSRKRSSLTLDEEEDDEGPQTPGDVNGEDIHAAARREARKMPKERHAVCEEDILPSISRCIKGASGGNEGIH